MDEFVDNDAIGRAFDRLRPKDRMILVLHHVEERPVAEIARSLASGRNGQVAATCCPPPRSSGAWRLRMNGRRLTT
jgi:hypothetical protein